MMADNITLHAFAAILARETGYTIDFCEKIAAGLFSVITDGLKSDGQVKLKGLGTFINDGRNVRFEPDDTLSATLNEPFADFEPIEVGTDYEEEEAAIVAEATADAEDEALQTETVEVNNAPKPVAVEPEPVAAAPTPVMIEQEAAPKAVSETPKAVSVEPTTETPIAANTVITEPKRTKRPWRGLWFVAGLIIGILLGYFVPMLNWSCFLDQIRSDNDIYTHEVERETIEDEIAVNEADGAINPENIESDNDANIDENKEDGKETSTNAKIESDAKEPVVLETVSANNFLATMSRRHYGTYEFWVYIYQENRDKIADPDKIEPGTVVVIPPAEKYGIDRNDPESLERARRLATEIYAEKRSHTPFKPHSFSRKIAL